MQLTDSITYTAKLNLTDFYYVLVNGAGTVEFEYWFQHDFQVTARYNSETGELMSDKLQPRFFDQRD